MNNLVVLEGCNGEWAQKCYLPFLVNKAAEGKIQLWAIDIQPQVKLAAQNVAGLWRDAKSKGNACYLRKRSGNTEPYEIPTNIDYVFIVTPDKYHCETAEFWRERLNRRGRILIEKPLDASTEKARELKIKMGETNIAYGFDHYLAKAHPFLRKRNGYLRKIGKISKIEFNILEPSGIPANQVKTLDKGVIFDLFCHVLAVVIAIVNRGFTFSEAIPGTIKLGDVIAAKYKNCPISGETFARMEFSISDNVKVIATLGKGVGKSEDKCLTIYAREGRIRLDFVKDHFICRYSSQHQDKGQLESRHVESFLEAILQGEKPLSAPGVLSFDTAFAILKLLGEAKNEAKVMPRRYDIGTSAEGI
jgi:predicted dehydrogenase